MTSIQVVSLGTYQGKSTARVYGFRRPDGTEFTIQKNLGPVVGGLYEVEVDEDGSTVSGFKWLGRRSDDAAELDVLDRERRSRIQRKAEERKAARGNPELNDLLDRVRAFSAELKTHEARDALALQLHKAAFQPRN